MALRRLLVGSVALQALWSLNAPGVAAAKPPYAPPAKSISAFDTTASIAGTAWFEAMYEKGFRLYVMHSTSWGTCRPWSRTERQLANALSVGLEVAAYTRNPACWRNGIEASGPFVSRLQFFALDIETDPGVAVTKAMVRGVSALGVRPVIYTGSRMWRSVQGADRTSFAGIPLWDTVANNHPDREALSASERLPAISYGGWNTASNPRMLVQRAFQVDEGGVMVDLDSVDASFLRGR